MSTCNFHSMDNFDLWAVSSDRFYYKFCPECGYPSADDGDQCSECSADLTDVDPVYDDLSADIFCDDLQYDIDAENSNLLFHEISIKSGYYDGLQLFVTTTKDADAAGFGDDQYLHDPQYGPDNYNTRYYFDLCRSAAIRKYQAEQRKVNKILARIGRAHGMDKLAIYARFSNGETWYTKTA